MHTNCCRWAHRSCSCVTGGVCLTRGWSCRPVGRQGSSLWPLPRCPERCLGCRIGRNGHECQQPVKDKSQWTSWMSTKKCCYLIFLWCPKMYFSNTSSSMGLGWAGIIFCTHLAEVYKINNLNRTHFNSYSKYQNVNFVNLVKITLSRKNLWENNAHNVITILFCVETWVFKNKGMKGFSEIFFVSQENLFVHKSFWIF